MRSGAGAGDLRDHLAHPLGGAELDALHQRHEDRVRRASRRSTAPRFSRSFCEGTESTTNSAPAAASSGSGVARTARGQLDPREVLGVLVPLVDRLAHLGPATPDGHVLAGVGEHEAERRTPGTGAEHRDLRSSPPSLLLLAGCRSRVTPEVFGSKRTAGAFSPRRSSTRAVIAAMIRSVASCSTSLVTGLPIRSLEVDRVADLVRRGLAREQVRPQRSTPAGCPAPPTARSGSPDTPWPGRSARRRSCRASASRRGPW